MGVSFYEFYKEKFRIDLFMPEVMEINDYNNDRTMLSPRTFDLLRIGSKKDYPSA